MVAGDFGQAGERSDVGCQSGVDFLWYDVSESEFSRNREKEDFDAEGGVRCGISDVAVRYEVNAEADDRTVYGDDDWSSTAFRGTYGPLKVEQKSSNV